MTTNYSVEEIRLPMPWGHVAGKAWGSPTNKPVLVVHGLLDNAGSFDRLIPLLPDKYYFVCIDLPGHGFSSHFPAGVLLNFFDYVHTIRRVLDSLKWDTCIYIAHSLGVQLGLSFSMLYPKRFEKIVCLDALMPVPMPNDRLVPHIRSLQDHNQNVESRTSEPLFTRDEMLYILKNMRITVLNVAAAEALMERSVTKVGEKYKLNRDLRLRLGLRVLLSIDQLIALFTQLSVPTLVILASEASSLARDKGILKVFAEVSLNDYYTFTTVRGNHDVHNNYPERVAPLISKFLNNLSSKL